MNDFFMKRTVAFEPLIGASGEPCSFGVMVKPDGGRRHVGELSIEWLRALVRSQQLVVLRGFDSFDDAQSLTRYCATFGEIMMWQFGAVLELVEHADPDDHIFANSYVPLHWDGMYLETVPEFQVFQCVQAVGEGDGGRTTFSSTTQALRIATQEELALWRRASGRYQRTVELYSNTVEAPIIGRHPRREFPILRFCEPPLEGDDTFINPSHYVFEGVAEYERKTLLDSLKRRLYDPRAHYAHHWQTGDVVLTDNFTLLHGRERFVSRTGRHLRRVHIHGEPPLRNPHLSKERQAADITA
ncbi:pyoverdine biosynthesis protein PvcB [Burkholderia singularis]|uniref:PvcB protein, related to amino acid oxidizing enzymes n=1 Tax=Burkholderia singularis TaxID=1503053 RepID=A0A103E6D0_9BURK|nr:TauD/TfdA family dioxygenase [Burkholderia singularis]KVE28876.1 pyoverdine biosynthesis protein PvcB [Burkholderia singularis]SMF99284.1 PvcB protein, related to amino acid oxidizing enzymes [Burkholderia singularis]